MKKYEFVEPHITGGHSTTIITEEQILKYMKKVVKRNFPEHLMTDEQLINDFITTHLCKEIKSE